MNLSLDSLQEFALKAKAAAEDWALQQLHVLTGEEKRTYARTWLKAQVEQYDNLIPIIGQFMDLPIIDGWEDWAIDQVLEWAYYMIESGLKTIEPA